MIKSFLYCLARLPDAGISYNTIICCNVLSMRPPSPYLTSRRVDWKCRTGKYRTNEGPNRSKTDQNDQKMRDQIFGVVKCVVIWIEKKCKNLLCIVVLHLYYLTLERIDYFVTAVITSTFNW